LDEGQLLHTLVNHRDLVTCVAFDPQGSILGSGSRDKRVFLWDVRIGRVLRRLVGHRKGIFCIAFNPDGDIMASGSDDGTVKLTNVVSGRLIYSLEVQNGRVWSIAFNPRQPVLASGNDDGTVALWDINNGRLLRTLEGHTGSAQSVAFLFDGTILASKGGGGDGTIRLWGSEIGDCLAVIPERASDRWPPSLAFHPHLPLLATVGSDPGVPEEECDRIIHIWELDPVVLLGQAAEPTAHYVNAKVVLVGDTGVGKTGLSLVLNNQPFAATDSTLGRRVWTLDSQEVHVSSVKTTIPP
jgi:WD40 repeat protein